MKKILLIAILLLSTKQVVFCCCFGQVNNGLTITAQAIKFDPDSIDQKVNPEDLSLDNLENTFLAMLKPGLNEKKAVINDQVIFVVKKGQLILYNDYAHMAFIADGRFGYIPPEDLQKIDTLYFKFNFSKVNFNLTKGGVLVKLTEDMGVDINSLTQKVINKDSESLLKLFELRYSFDASTEVFYAHFWSLLNLWTDDELAEFIKGLNTVDKKSFCNYITDYAVTFPIEKPLVYYKLYYPQILKIIKEIK